MKFVLREEQSLATNDAITFFANAAPGDKRLYAAPTGVGKSVIELHVLSVFPDAAIITPRIEIVAGMLDKLGYDVPSDANEETITLAGQLARIWTPIRLRNVLLRGEMQPPAKLIFDESHHHNADSWQTLDLLTAAPAIGYTATPYRGTPKSTESLLKRWGDPVWIITYPQAVARGLIAMPNVRIVPLIDDDKIEVVNGEFAVTAVENATQSIFAQVADELATTRPTMITVPSRMIAIELARYLTSAGLHADAITDKTPQTERRRIFADCVACRTTLVQINTVSEGVDLPIRVQFDLSPVMSPVRFLQRFGRTTRPVKDNEQQPEYVCFNRNILRHAYLLEGCLPPKVVIEATKAFGVGTRPATRVVGLEGTGRFKPIQVPFLDGTVGAAYCVSALDGITVTEYAAIVHPVKEEPVWATRANVKKPDGTKAYGKWVRCDAPGALDGFASISSRSLSDKQKAWWKKDAKTYGLDPDAKVTNKSFQVLPILHDIRMRFR